MADDRPRDDPGKIRQRMRRLYTKLKRQCASLKEHKEDTPVADLPLYSIDRVAADTDTEKSLYYNMLQDLLDVEPEDDLRAQDEERAEEYLAVVAETNDLSQYLLSLRSCNRKTAALESSTAKVRALHDEEPAKDYATLVSCLKEDLDSLKRALEKSPMEAVHPMRAGADRALEATYLLLTDIKKPGGPPRDLKPHLEEGGAGIKRTPFNPPRFSGDQKDWISFRSEFKSIHDSLRYAPATKLSYLRQAMINPSLRRQIGICIDNGDSYEQVMKMLQDQFDRPRLTHKIYVDQLLAIGQVKPQKSAILE